MRDPGELVTKRGTPGLLIISRCAFLLYFAYATYAVLRPPLPLSRLNIVWVLYLLAMYLMAEKFYAIFKERNIDMAFAFPLLLAVYFLNLVSLLLAGQEKMPLMNRMEHFATFILLAYVVSVFFSEYLPHRVWQNHPYYTAILIMAICSLFGAGNEIIELIFDSWFGTHHIGEKLDTSLDLLMNTLGSGLLLGVRLIVTGGRKI